ncbi:SPASM domain-containing protein [Candidatus Bipolaricaulota bacterium]|nr:SPASM domain-containing protein [Candidatus Bipolaricaulota bacterium]
MCKIDARCGSYLVVEHNGDIYPCDFFVVEDQKLGNLNERSLRR